MASRYYHLEDDRELDDAPTWAPCDACQTLVAVVEDDDDEDTPVLCLDCANAQARDRRKSA